MSNTDLLLCPIGGIGRHATQTEKESASLCRYRLYIDRRNINGSDVYAILLIKYIKDDILAKVLNRYKKAAKDKD